MNSLQTVKTTHPLVIIAAISVAVFSLIGSAAILGWIPNSRGTTAPAPGSVSEAVAVHKLAAGTAVEASNAETRPAPARRATVQAPKYKPVQVASAPVEAPVTVRGESARAVHNAPAPSVYSAPAPSVYNSPAPSVHNSPAPSVHSEPVAARTEAPIEVARAEPARRQCYECGTIEAVRETEKPAETNGVGIGIGAVTGGLLGHQMGRGNGNTAMTVLGAIGGAFAGHQVEKKVRTVKEYRLTVRFEDGSAQQVVQSTPPAWREGDKVKVVNGALVSNG